MEQVAQECCGCPIPRTVQGQVGWEILEQLGLLNGFPAHGRGLELDDLQKSLEVLNIAWRSQELFCSDHLCPGRDNCCPMVGMGPVSLNDITGFCRREVLHMNFKLGLLVIPSGMMLIKKVRHF